MEELKKVCKKCGIEKDLNEFHRVKKGEDRRRTTCKECRSTKKETNKEGNVLIPAGHKMCTCCNAVKILDDFPKDKSGKFGKSSKCKKCHNERTKKWAKKNREKLKEYKRQWYEKQKLKREKVEKINDETPQVQEGYKVCSKCKEEKELEEFNNAKRKKDGKYSWCKECKRKDDKKRRKENHEKYKEFSRRSYKKWKEQNPERKKEIQRRYKKSPKGRANNLKEAGIRRARLLNATMEEFCIVSDIFERDNWTCFYCGKQADENGKIGGKTVEHDHYIPISKGGEHSRRNCTTSCSDCNGSKGATLPHLWRSDLPETIDFEKLHRLRKKAKEEQKEQKDCG